MAHTYVATVHWSRGDAVFSDGRYSRAHEWSFDGGTVVPASSAPSSVRLPYSRADAVDPEEALVASVSSCHMLFFLAFALKDGFRVDDYRDDAEGVMTPNENNKLYVSRITLKPRIVFSGDKKPNANDIARLHHHAHEECYIANSVRADIDVAVIDPVYA